MFFLKEPFGVREVVFWSVLYVAVIVLCVVLIMNSGCATCINAFDTRCNGTVLEICGSNHEWHRVIDCNVIRDNKNVTEMAEWVCDSGDNAKLGATCVHKVK
jgi:hypothetical protein